MMWNKLPVLAIGTSIWASPISSDVLGEDIPLPKDELEQLFAAAIPQKSKPLLAAGSDGPCSPKENGPVSLLDGRKAQNIAILLSAAKSSPSGLKMAILKMDLDVVNAVVCRQLLTHACSPQDHAMVHDFSAANPNARLGVAENLLLTLSSIPQLKERLEAQSLRLSFQSKCNDLESDSHLILKAAEDLKSSQNFAALLRIVLHLGNFLNGGTFRGRALGFSLSSLQSLADTRSTDGQMNFLHYLVQYVCKNKPHLLRFIDDLDSSHNAAKVGWTVIREDGNALRSHLKSMQRSLSSVEIAAEGEMDLFATIICEFEKLAEERMSRLEELIEKAQAKFIEVAQYFAEEKPEKTSTADLFGAISHFIACFTKAHKDLSSEKCKMEREVKRAEEKEKRVRAFPIFLAAVQSYLFLLLLASWLVAS